MWIYFNYRVKLRGFEEQKSNLSCEYFHNRVKPRGFEEQKSNTLCETLQTLNGNNLCEIFSLPKMAAIYVNFQGFLTSIDVEEVL